MVPPPPNWNPPDPDGLVFVPPAAIVLDKSLPINPDKSGAVPILSRNQVWRGLMMKVDDARPFVPLMTKCEVTERWDNGLLRDIAFDGMALSEKITFYPKQKIEFERVGDGGQ